MTLNRVSSYFAQIDPMRWTPHLDECMRVLRESKDCAADEVFAIEVRVQLLLHKANQMAWPAGGPDGENTDIPVIPPAFFLKVIRSQLQELKAELSAEVQQNGKLDN